jgi:hypothetical protein
MKTKTHSTEQIVEERVSLRFSDFSVLFEKNEYPSLPTNYYIFSVKGGIAWHELCR